MHSVLAMKWGCTDREVKEHLPGDDLVLAAALQSTRGLSIALEPREVWRWLAQAQHLRPGDFIRGAGRTWRVIEAEFARHLVLSTGMTSWTFVLRPLDDGAGTRLVVRNRLPQSGLLWKGLIDPSSFVFERRMLLGMREHAENN
jgi:hypothetical protein